LRFSNFFKVRSAAQPALARALRRGVQEADTGIGIIDDRGERLVDLMCYGGGQFTHGGQPCHMSKFSLRLAQSLFGLLALQSDTRQMGDLLDRVMVLRSGTTR